MKAMIIGMGRMGQRHLQVCHNLGLEIIGLYDIAPKATSDGLSILPSGAFINDLDKKPELVIIASTAPSHFEYMTACFSANIPFILSEKPLCTSWKQLTFLEETFESATQSQLCVNHPMRFMEHYTKVKALIENAHFGPLSSVSVQAGNMGAAMNATHYFEAVRYLTNEYAQRVWGWLEPQNAINPRGAHYLDHSGAIRFETQSGIRCYLDFSQNQGHGLWVTYTCLNGQIHVDELAGKIYTSCRKNKADLTLPTTRYGLESLNQIYDIKPTEPIEPTEKLLKAFIDGNDYPTLKNGLMTVKTLIAAHASSDMYHAMIDMDSLPTSYQEKEFAWA